MTAQQLSDQLNSSFKETSQRYEGDSFSYDGDLINYETLKLTCQPGCVTILTQRLNDTLYRNSTSSNDHAP